MRALKPAHTRALVLAALLASATHASAAPPKRAIPDYDGRGGEPTTTKDAVLWVPRLAVGPLYLVHEYGIRRPLGAVIGGAERAGLPQILYDFFVFGPEHKAGVIPIAFFDFGFHPDLGAYAFWDDFLFDGHDAHVHVSGWDSEWIAAVLTERLRFDHGNSVELTLSGIRRPDHMFYGIGPDTTQSNLSRYASDRLEASLHATFPFWRASRIETSAGLRSVSLDHGHFGGDPSLEVAAARGAFAIPYAFERGYTAQTSRVAAALDTRLPRPASGSGVRVEVDVEEGADVRRAPGSAWIRYGATAGAFLDLNGRNRVLSVSLSTMLADPLGREPIPFTELVSLGGAGPMRGFYPGRLVDRSATALTLRYRWPIWVWLDGSIQAATGNVFGERFDALSVSRLRLSGAIGVESVGAGDSSLEVLIGVGTETFAHGTQLDTVRLSVGTNRGF